MTLRNYWHPIARSDEVVEQPKQFRLLDENLVVFRTTGGVVALKDVCIHRGTSLSLGWVENGLITCAYHGWQYDCNGICVRIPSLPEGSAIPPKARTPAYRTEERYGLVWVALDEPAAPIPPFPPGLFDSSEFRTFLVYDGTWETSAGRATENALDTTHFAWVHENLLGTRDNAVTPEHTVLTRGGTITYEMEVPQPSAHDHYAYTLHLPFALYLEASSRDKPDRDWILVSASPVSAKKTRMFIWRGRDYSLEPATDQPIGDFERTLAYQDKAIVESQRPEQIPLDLREEIHLKVPDAIAIAYRKLLAGIDHDGSHMP